MVSNRHGLPGCPQCQGVDAAYRSSTGQILTSSYPAVPQFVLGVVAHRHGESVRIMAHIPQRGKGHGTGNRRGGCGHPKGVELSVLSQYVVQKDKITSKNIFRYENPREEVVLLGENSMVHQRRSLIR